MIYTLAVLVLTSLVVALRAGAIAWPAPLLPFARRRLRLEHRFALPASRPAGDPTSELDDGSGARDVPAIGALRAGGLRITGAPERVAIAVTRGPFEALVRVQARREGDEIVLSATQLPLPLVFVLALNAILVAWVLRISPVPWMLGLLIAPLIPAASMVSRAADASATDIAQKAFAAIEDAMRGATAAAPPTRARIWGELAGTFAAAIVVLGIDQGFPRVDALAPPSRALRVEYHLEDSEARRLVALVREEQLRVMGEPAWFHALFPDYERVPQELEYIAAADLRALDDEDVIAYQGVLAEIASRSASACAAFGRERIEPRDVVHAVASASDETLRAWAQLAERAVERSSAPESDSPESVRAAAIAAILAQLPDLERPAYEARLRGGTGPTGSARACDRFRAWSDGVARLEPADRARAIRAFLGPPSATERLARIPGT